MKILAKALEKSDTLLNSHVPDTSAERCSGKIWIFYLRIRSRINLIGSPIKFIRQSD